MLRTPQQVTAQSKRWYLEKQLAKHVILSLFKLTELDRLQQDQRLHLG